MMASAIEMRIFKQFQGLQTDLRGQKATRAGAFSADFPASPPTLPLTPRHAARTLHLLRRILSLLILLVWAFAWARCTAERSGIVMDSGMQCCSASAVEHFPGDHHGPEDAPNEDCSLCTALDAVMLPAPFILIAVALCLIAAIAVPALWQLLSGVTLVVPRLRRPPPDDGVGFSEWLLGRACPVRGPSLA